MFNFLKKQPHIIAVNCVFNCPRSEKCPKWITLKSAVKSEDGVMKEVFVGRCAEVWSVFVQLEMKQTLEKLLGDKNKHKILVP
jgi:hypothetical protein